MKERRRSVNRRSFCMAWDILMPSKTTGGQLMDKHVLGVMILAFLVDLLLLRAAAGNDPGGVRPWKMVAAAFFGGIYTGSCMFPRCYFLHSWPCRIISLVIMGFVAFGLRPDGLKSNALFVFLWLCVGGMTAGIQQRSFWFPVLAVSLLTLLALMGSDGECGNRFIPITIHYGDKTVHMTALADTGNMLTDPISGEQVLIVSPKTGEYLLGLSCKELRDPVTAVASGKVSGLRLIPYSAVGCPNGMLAGIRFGETMINGRKSSRVVAFSPNPIGDGKHFDALAGGMI